MSRKNLAKTLHTVVEAFRVPEKKKAAEEENWVRFHKGKTIEVPIQELNDYHLLKAIEFLEKHAELLQKKTVTEGVSVHNFMRKLQTLDYSTSALNKIKRLTPQEFLRQETIYPKLYKEAQKRRLPAPPMESWGGYIG